MTDLFRRVRRPAAILLAVLLLAGLEGVAQSASGIDPVLQAPLREALQAIQRSQMEQAIEQLQSLLGRPGLTPYDKATVARFLGHARMRAGLHEAAIVAFARAIASGALSSAEHDEVHYQLGQLYLRQGQAERAVEHLRKLDRKDYPKAAWYLSRAQGQLGEHESAIQAAEQVLKDTDRPDRSDIDHLLRLYEQTGQPKQALALITRAVAWYPEEKAYWQRQARLHLEVQQGREALSVLRAMHRQGMLTEEAEIIQLVDLHLHLDAPLQAAELLQQAISSGQIDDSVQSRQRLASAWLQAHEWQRAEKQLQVLVGNDAEPTLHLDLALAYSKQEKWLQAIETYERALRSERLQNEGEVWLLLGIAAVNAEALDRAYTALREAEAYPAQQARAREWLAWLDRRSAMDTGRK